jgi:hypothetical protein
MPVVRQKSFGRYLRHFYHVTITNVNRKLRKSRLRRFLTPIRRRTKGPELMRTRER